MSSDAFWAALGSVGTAAALAAMGFSLHRRQMVTSETKQALARFSQQVALPSLFFSKIVRCGSGSSNNHFVDFAAAEEFSSCSSVLDHCRDAWILLLWPVYICGCGLLVGHIGATYFSKTPASQRGSVCVATAFANSGALPITLLTVIEKNLERQGIASSIGPNQFLSIYLVVYPILQWSVGGWILSTEGELQEKQNNAIETAQMVELCSPKYRTKSSNIGEQDDDEDTIVDEEQLNLAPLSPRSTIDSAEDPFDHESRKWTKEQESSASFSASLQKFLSRALQPPVVGSLSGLLVTAIRPARALFVDVTGKNDATPLGWLFDAIVCAGQASVPVSMAILGVNLSLAAAQSNNRHVVSWATVSVVVTGKMIVLPLIGIASTLLLQQIWAVPKEIYTSFYLVLAIEWIPPTANNVMVMVDLMGSNGMKETMARIIGLQYLAAPILLSMWVMVVVRLSTVPNDI